MDWHCDGFGFGEIARALILGELDGDEETGAQDLLDLKDSGMGWGEIKKQYDVHPSELAPGQVISGKVRFVDIDDEDEDMDEDGDDEDEIDVEPLDEESDEQRVPPGQAKKDDDKRVPPGQAKKDDAQRVPPGQAKKANPGKGNK